MKLGALLLISCVLINLDCSVGALTFLVKPSSSTDELVVYGNRSLSVPSGDITYLRIVNAIRTNDGITTFSIWQNEELVAVVLLQLGHESVMYRVNLGSAIRVTAAGNTIPRTNNTLQYNEVETSVDIIVMNGDGESYLLQADGAVPYGVVTSGCARLKADIILLSLTLLAAITQ